MTENQPTEHKLHYQERAFAVMDVNYKSNLKETLQNHSEGPFPYGSKVTSEFSDFLYEEWEKHDKLPAKPDEDVKAKEDSKSKCTHISKHI
jgi:hypothetical protein